MVFPTACAAAVVGAPAAKIPASAVTKAKAATRPARVDAGIIYLRQLWMSSPGSSRRSRQAPCKPHGDGRDIRSGQQEVPAWRQATLQREMQAPARLDPLSLEIPQVR